MTREIRARDPLLFWAGASMLLGLVVVTLISIGDQRVVLGVSTWLKPMKFLTSIAIFLWTTAWFMPDTESRPVQRAIVRWTIVTAMLIEIALIIMQAARGTTSHFNQGTAFDAAVFSVMGMAITISTLAMMLFLWIVRRDTPSARAGYLWGVRLGLTLFILASWQGFAIVVNGAHTVPPPDGGPGLPLVNWSTTAGDLRTVHFFGMHALQALPVIGFLADRTGVLPAKPIVLMAAALWALVVLGLFIVAARGHPLIAL